MNIVLAVAIAAFAATFALLIRETADQDERELARRRHPSRAR